MPNLSTIFSQIILIVSDNIRGIIDTTTHLFALVSLSAWFAGQRHKDFKPPSVAFTQYADPNRVIHGQSVIWIVVAIDHKLASFA